MLVLTRKKGEKIFIGDDISVTITKIEKQTVGVGIEAPRDIEVRRDDIKKTEPKE